MAGPGHDLPPHRQRDRRDEGPVRHLHAKPMHGVNGSGMHVHQSLFTGKRNAFFDANDPASLSKVGRSYIAGLLAHVKEIALVTNQWVNSYKRLVPGYEAPVYICWSRRNRSAMVRVPLYKPGKENATRVELRNPDPACNPYLAFAAMLAAGLDGIEKGMELPPEQGDNIFEMTEAQREAAGIGSLPGDLNEATKEFAKSSFVREALGDHVCDYLISEQSGRVGRVQDPDHPVRDPALSSYPLGRAQTVEE